MADKYADSLRRQLAMNGQTWGRLTELGVGPDTELSLGFSFYCPNEAAAAGLSEALTAAGHTVSSRRGGTFLRRVWVVEGETAPSAWSLEKLNEWVTTMVSQGQAHGSEFDGWGAHVPSQ